VKRVLILPSFERSVKRLDRQNKDDLAEGLESFNEFLVSGKTPAGFGFKKIGRGIYEFRVDIRLRVIIKVEGEDYYLVLAGNHDDVRRYLRHYGT
jgi:mRNA-degrading endonuclease RelE of RelBE toxin-antitoxin system